MFPKSAKGNVPLKILSWCALVFYSFLILYLSFQPGEEIPSWVNVWDKLLHFIEYAALCLMTAMVLVYSIPHANRKSILAAAILYSAAMGVLTECIQAAVPGRVFSIGDLLANASGILLVGLFLRQRS